MQIRVVLTCLFVLFMSSQPGRSSIEPFSVEAKLIEDLLSDYDPQVRFEVFELKKVGWF